MPNYTEEQLKNVIDHCQCNFKITRVYRYKSDLTLDNNLSIQVNGYLDDDQNLVVESIIDKSTGEHIDPNNSIIPAVSQAIVQSALYGFAPGVYEMEVEL